MDITHNINLKINLNVFNEVIRVSTNLNIDSQFTFPVPRGICLFLEGLS